MPIRLIAMTLAGLLACAALLASEAGAACKTQNEEVRSLIDEHKIEQAKKMAEELARENAEELDSQLALAEVYLKIAFKKGAPSVITRDAALKAAATLEKIVQKWPKEHSPHFCLLEAYEHLGDREKHLSTLMNTAADLKHEGNAVVDNLLHHAKGYHEREDFDTAAIVYAGMMEHYPGNEKLISSYGVIRLKQGFIKEAHGLFTRAYKIRPTDTIILRNVAESAIYLRNYKKAKKFLKLYLKESPDSTSAYFDLAILAMYDYPEPALDTWDRYLEQNEKNPDSAQWAQNGKIIRGALAEGMSLDDHYSLADQFIKSGTLKYAVPLLDMLTKRDKGEPFYHYRLSEIYNRMQDYDLSYHHLRLTEKLVMDKGYKGDIAPLHVHCELGRLAYAKELYGESHSYLKKCEAADDSYNNLQYMLGLVSIALGDIKQTNEYFRQCRKKQNNSDYADQCQEIPIGAPLTEEVDFRTAVSIAEKMEKNQYLTQYSQNHFYQPYVRTITQCLDELKEPDTSQYKVVLIMNKSGKIARTLYNKSTNITECLDKKIRKTKFTRPVVAPYYLYIQMNFN